MRIIAGFHKGARIEAPKGLQTRPTSDRVKESVFGMLQFELSGKAVLDLFAGSGNMGLEALSRGAKHCVFNDSAKESVAVIRNNIEKLRLTEASSVYMLDFSALLRRASMEGLRFDIVFLDPPYDIKLLDKALFELVQTDLLKENCLIVAEHMSRAEPVAPKGCSLRERRRYGETAVSIFVKAEGA